MPRQHLSFVSNFLLTSLSALFLGVYISTFFMPYKYVFFGSPAFHIVEVLLIGLFFIRNLLVDSNKEAIENLSKQDTLPFGRQKSQNYLVNTSLSVAKHIKRLITIETALSTASLHLFSTACTFQIYNLFERTFTATFPWEYSMAIVISTGISLCTQFLPPVSRTMVLIAAQSLQIGVCFSLWLVAPAVEMAEPLQGRFYSALALIPFTFTNWSGSAISRNFRGARIIETRLRPILSFYIHIVILTVGYMLLGGSNEKIAGFIQVLNGQVLAPFSAFLIYPLCISTVVSLNSLPAAFPTTNLYYRLGITLSLLATHLSVPAWPKAAGHWLLATGSCLLMCSTAISVIPVALLKRRTTYKWIVRIRKIAGATILILLALLGLPQAIQLLTGATESTNCEAPRETHLRPTLSESPDKLYISKILTTAQEVMAKQFVTYMNQNLDEFITKIIDRNLVGDLQKIIETNGHTNQNCQVMTARALLKAIEHLQYNKKK